MPRFAGPASMMRLPTTKTAADHDAHFVGVSFDIGSALVLNSGRLVQNIFCCVPDTVSSTLGGDHTIVLPIMRGMKR